MNKYREVECGGCAPPAYVPLREGKTRGNIKEYDGTPPPPPPPPPRRNTAPASKGAKVQHVELTSDVGASVEGGWWGGKAVLLTMGGDLSISISIPNAAAKEFANALLAAADPTPGPRT